MRRPLLVSLMVLGLVVTAVGGMGVFAPFTDRATTGTNSVTSGARPKAADLKLQFGVTVLSVCDDAEAYSDNLETPALTATDAQPGFRDFQYFCLRNAGSAPLTVSMRMIDVVDTDVACTNDEGAVDTTCGEDGEGELAEVLYISTSAIPCEGGVSPLPTFNQPLSSGASYTYPGTLAAGARMCGFVEVFYPLNRPVDEVLAAQSDKATWRYAFDATT